MKLPRRRFLHLAASAVALPAFSHTARAQAYPTRPVQMIAMFPAGSAPDIIARLAGQWLSERLGQQFVIENRPGFGGNIATEFVVRAPADGYTLLMPVSTNAVNAALYPNLNFNFIRDIAPVAGIANAPFVMAVPFITPGQNRSGDSSPMPTPIQARSIWPRAETGARPISSVSCSRQ